MDVYYVIYLSILKYNLELTKTLTLSIYTISMKKISFIILLSFIAPAIIEAQNSQLFTYENFVPEIINFKPIQRENVSDKSYNKAIKTLNYTYSKTEKKIENFNVADYWNITLSLMRLGEPKQNIEIAFKKGIDADSESMCEYIKAINEMNPQTIENIAVTIPEIFNGFYKVCKGIKIENEEIDIGEYSDGNKLNIDLVKLFDKISKKDKLYRDGKNWDKQHLLDSQNQTSIDSIYNIKGKYIGKSLVGSEYEHIMWLVIQHSNINMMNKYLPVINKAVIDGELKNGPLQMLIDRIYTIETGTQIFGSQGGVDYAPDEIIEKVKREYNM